MQTSNIPFISEVETFNLTFGKIHNTTPTLVEEKDWKFVHGFIDEELQEYKEACEAGDIVEIADALGDLVYVISNGIITHGLQEVFPKIYEEIQASNMSKACKTEMEAETTVQIRSEQQGTACHYEKVGNLYIVYRSHDRKVMKSINYFKPNLKKILDEHKQLTN